MNNDDEKIANAWVIYGRLQSVLTLFDSVTICDNTDEQVEEVYRKTRKGLLSVLVAQEEYAEDLASVRKE